MKRSFLKQLLLLLGASSALSAVAYDVHVESGYYNIDKDAKTAVLTCYAYYSADNVVAYAGDVVIPETFEYEGDVYTVTSVSSRTFYDCTNLTSVELPATITSMGNNAFYNCIALKHVLLPEQLTEMEYNTFQNCISLEEIVLPDLLTSIKSATFAGCESLQSVQLPSSLSTIETNAFYGCSSLKGLDFPSTLQTISPRAFYNCTSLETLQFPDGLKEFKMSCFQNCTGLKSVSIGSAVQSIDSDCFADCPQLADVYCSAPTPPANVYSSIFNGTSPNRRLHIPNESIEAYHSKGVWKQFAEFLPLQCASPEVTCSDGLLTFTTDTNLSYSTVGESFVYTIDVADVCTDAVIDATEEAFCDLSLTYDLSVIATAEGCDDSEAVEVQLCWIDADNSFVADASDIITAIDAPAQQRPVLVASRGGELTVTGLADGERAALYDLSGRQLGGQTAAGGSVNFTAAAGQVVIVRVGSTSFKVRVN